MGSERPRNGANGAQQRQRGGQAAERSAPPQGTLLLVDEEASAAWASWGLERALQAWDCISVPAEQAHRLPADTKGIDVVLAPTLEPESRTRQLVRDLHDRLPGVPVILLSGNGRGGADAVRAGAFDQLRKPLDPDAVLLCLSRAVERRRLVAENERLKQAVALLRRREQLTGSGLLGVGPCETLSCVVRERMSLGELEDRYVDAILRLTGGNKMRAAEILGIHRRTLYRRAERRANGSGDGNGSTASA